MDLGTANTLIYMRSHGVVVNEPSMVAVEEKSRKLIAIGNAAKRMFGKTSQATRCIRPMKDGVIADFEMTAAMIQYMLQQVGARFSLRGLALVPIPVSLTLLKGLEGSASAAVVPLAAGPERRPTRLMQITGPDAYVFAPADGVFEPFHPLGAEVKKGEPAGQVNFLDDPGRAPVVARFRSDGLLFCKRAPGRVERGNGVCVLLTDYAGD